MTSMNLCEMSNNEKSCSDVYQFAADASSSSDADDDVFKSSPSIECAKEQIFLSSPLTRLQINACSVSPENPTAITLLEKIVRSHPIWYLPHMGRIAVMHLLRNKDPGVFIVRHSSQPNSMAISIKLPFTHCQEVEHYLIETTIAGVRLEGSLNYFAALPILLAHYCQYGDELPLKLLLPPAIMNCEVRRELCSLGLLGQDFWSSEHCQNINYSQVSLYAVSNDIEPNICHRNHNAPSPPTRLRDELLHNQPATSSADSSPLPAKHRRSMSLSNCPQTIANDSVRHQVQFPPVAQERKVPKIKTNVKLKQRSESVSDSKDKPAEFNDRKFSWKSLFENPFRSASQNSSDKRGHKEVEFDKQNSNHTNSTWYREVQLDNDDDTNADDAMLSEPAYFAATHIAESKSVNSLLQTTDESVFDTPNMSRKRLLTFKPGTSPGSKTLSGPGTMKSNHGSLERSPKLSNGKSSKLNNGITSSISVNALSCVTKQNSDFDCYLPMNSSISEAVHEKPKPPIKPRLMLRREKSDLGWLPGYDRQANGHEQHSEKSTFNGNSLTRAITNARNAMLPPAQNVDQSFKTCVEELRKRRIESAKSNITNQQQNRSVHSKRDGSPHILSRDNSLNSKTRKISELLQLRKAESTKSSPTNSLSNTTLRNKPPSGNSRLPVVNRLSAPNLADPTTIEHRTVSEMLKELKFRQTKPAVPTTPLALDTINEGLATPMAMRREMRKKAERRLSQSLEDVSMPYIDHEDVEVFLEKYEETAFKKNSPERVSRSQSARSSSTSQKVIVNYREEKKRRDERVFHNETNFQWVAVTSEIKNRQKIAKVAHVLNSDSRFSNGSTSSSSNDKTRSGSTNHKSESDYALLQDCSEMFADDNVYGRYGSVGRMNSSEIENGIPAMQAEKEDSEDTRSVISAAGTVFSEPWDSSVWENLLHLVTSMDGNNESAEVIPAVQTRTVPKKEVLKLKQENFKNGNGTCSSSLINANNGCGSPNPKPSMMMDRLKKLKENNVPPPLAPTWEEFANHVPMSSSGSTATNSLEKPHHHHHTAINVLIRDPSCSAIEEEKFRLGPVLSPARFREGKFKFRAQADPSMRIQQCVDRLAKDFTTFFGAQVQYFIKCTLEAQETDPHIVVGNVRQFMNGIKNYLVKHGEQDLHALIEQERSKLQYTEFLNIDAILEGVLQKIVLQPLKPHLYHILVKESSRNGSLHLLSENMAVVRGKSAEELGIKAHNCETVIMEQVRHFFRKMQNQYSPLKKLENLLRAVSLAYCGFDQGVKATSFNANCLPTADELLKWFVFLVSRCSVVGCEIEAAFMWGLLHPALLSGEASYYLTAFSSAIHVLKHIDLLPKLQDSCSLSSDISEMTEGFLKVAIPNETSGAITYHSFPAVPQMNGSKFCRMIAHKSLITNPEDYGLYLLVDGYETCLLPSECPELVKEQLKMAGKPHMFAYKRHEAKIAWPKVAVSPQIG